MTYRSGICQTVQVGLNQMQPSGYMAFVPHSFPPDPSFAFTVSITHKHAEALKLLGRLEGLTERLPNKSFFLQMFMKKEGASSSQIEGTRATMTDAVEAAIATHMDLPADVEDIVLYVRALNHGLNKLTFIPLSVRLIREVHYELMSGARHTQHPYPGEFRHTQNWIRGTSPSNAVFVPPPPHEIPRAIADLEKFIHSTEDYPPLIKAALIHAQFETIHPFTDGNGRTGRLLITLFLCHAKLLEAPLLYLSDFFKKHQQLYYELLQGYHRDPSEFEAWVEFFLDGVIETARSASCVAQQIDQIREEDLKKIRKELGKTAAASAEEVLRHLYEQPIVDLAKVQEWTKFTRAGAQKVIDRLTQLNILIPRYPDRTYGKIYAYHSYLALFDSQSIRGCLSK